MSRLGTSRNVQWSAEGVTNSLCSRAHNLVHLSSLRWGYLDEKTKKMKENFFEKNKKCIFGRNPKASYFMTETLIVQKVAYIYAVLLERERFLYLFSVLRTMSYECEKNFRKNLLSSFLPKNTEYEKNFDVIFKPKGSVWNACKLYETMDPVSGLGSEK